MPPEVKTVKNSKLPKLSENCFEPVGKGGWPPISTWIKETIDFDSNILSLDCLNTRSEKDKKKQREDSPASSNPTTSHPKLDKMKKTLKDLTSEIDNLKWESKQPKKKFQGVGNRNLVQFRRSNDALR
jgi:hypothetical protein